MTENGALMSAIFAENATLMSVLSRLKYVTMISETLMDVVLYMSRRVIAVLLLSFSSGLPLLLVGSTLQAWYTQSGVDLMTIGMLTLVGQPYVYKFLWAPLMDFFVPMKLGRRQGWIFCTQVALVVGLVIMALMQPKNDPWRLAQVAFFVAFFSASQDIAIDAYRVDILQPQERGLGAAVTSFAERFAILVAGALALIMADEIGWRLTYLIMAALMVINMGVTRYWAPRPERMPAPQNLKVAVIEPIRNFVSRRHWPVIILFIIVYKLSDAFALSLNTAFLLRGLHFTLLEVGAIYKVTSLVGLLIGSVVGGVWMRRLGLYRSLLYFGVLQALANLGYMALSLVGKSYIVMATAVFIEYFSSGLSTVAFISFLMSLCDHRYSASQYAIFSAFMAIGRVYVGPVSAWLVTSFGWTTFYCIACIIGIPSLLLLKWMRRRIKFTVDQPVG